MLDLNIDQSAFNPGYLLLKVKGKLLSPYRESSSSKPGCITNLKFKVDVITDIVELLRRRDRMIPVYREVSVPGLFVKEEKARFCWTSCDCLRSVC